jgi:hypothetical protein
MSCRVIPAAELRGRRGCPDCGQRLDDITHKAQRRWAKGERRQPRYLLRATASAVSAERLVELPQLATVVADPEPT